MVAVPFVQPPMHELAVVDEFHFGADEPPARLGDRAGIGEGIAAGGREERAATVLADRGPRERLKAWIVGGLPDVLRHAEYNRFASLVRIVWDREDFRSREKGRRHG